MVARDGESFAAVLQLHAVFEHSTEVLDGNSPRVRVRFDHGSRAYRVLMDVTAKFVEVEEIEDGGDCSSSWISLHDRVR